MNLQDKIRNFLIGAGQTAKNYFSGIQNGVNAVYNNTQPLQASSPVTQAFNPFSLVKTAQNSLQSQNINSPQQFIQKTFGNVGQDFSNFTQSAFKKTLGSRLGEPIGQVVTAPENYVANRVIQPTFNAAGDLYQANQPNQTPQQKLGSTFKGLLNAAVVPFNLTPLGVGWNTYGGIKNSELAYRKGATPAQQAKSLLQGFSGQQDNPGLGNTVTDNPILATALNAAEFVAPFNKDISKGLKGVKDFSSYLKDTSVWHPEDINVLDRSVDILRSKKGNLNDAKQAIYNLAERYLPKDQLPESGNINVLIKRLQKTTQNNTATYQPVPGMGFVDNSKPTKNNFSDITQLVKNGKPFTLKTPQTLYHGSGTEGIKTLKAGTGNFGDGVYLTKDIGQARNYAAGWAGGVDPNEYNAVKNGQIYRVESQAQKLFQHDGSPLSKEQINMIKQKGFDGIQTPDETVIFDPKKVKIVGNATPEEFNKTNAVETSPKVQPFKQTFTPIQLDENLKVKPKSPEQMLRDLNSPGLKGESVLQQEGRYMQMRLKNAQEDPFIQGLEEDKARWNNPQPQPGDMGGGYKEPPPPPGQQYSDQGAEQAAGQALVNSENKKVFDDIFRRFIGKRDAARTTGFQTGYKYKDIPVKNGEEVINAIEHPERPVSDALKPYVDRIRNEYDNLYKYAKTSGVDLNYVKNYITHIWDQPLEKVQQMYLAAKQRGFFQNERKLPTYEEGKSMGLVPKYTHPAAILSEYTRKLEEVKAGLQMFKDLQKEGLVVDAYVGHNRPGFKVIDAPGFPRSSSMEADGKIYQGNYYAPKEIADQINKLFSEKQSTPVLGGLKTLSGKIQDVTLSGGIPKTPLNAFTFAQVQKEMLSVRFKSPISSLIRGISKENSLKFFQENGETIKKMQKNNIPVASEMNPENIVKGTVINRTLGEKVGHLWNTTVNDPTFKRFMPQLQINFFNDIEKQALKKGLTAEEAEKIAVKATKNFYGITGTDVMAKHSQLREDTLGAFFFAPKFRESMINFWGNNFKSLKNPLALENRGNIKFLVGATMLFLGYNAANQAINGHPMWENPSGTEDKLLIPLGDGHTLGIPFLSSIATVPRALLRQGSSLLRGDISTAVKDAGQSYLSSGVKPFADIAANQDYFGNEITNSNDTTKDKFTKDAGYLLKQTVFAHPYAQFLLDRLIPSGDARKYVGLPKDKTPLYQAISQGLEAPLKFYKDSSLKAYDYYASKDKAVEKLSNQEKSALDAIPKSDTNDPNSTIFKYQTYLTYPNVFKAKQQIELDMAQKTNQPIDPLYLVNYDTAKKYMRYETLPPGSQDRKDLLKANPELGALFDIRAKYFAENPLPDQKQSTRPIPSDYVQKQIDLKNWSDPQVKNYLDANTAYNNSQREKLGLTPLAGFTPYAKKPKKIKLKKSKPLKALKLPKLKALKTKSKAVSLKAPKIKQTKQKNLSFKGKPLKIKYHE